MCGYDRSSDVRLAYSKDNLRVTVTFAWVFELFYTKGNKTFIFSLIFRNELCPRGDFAEKMKRNRGKKTKANK